MFSWIRRYAEWLHLGWPAGTVEPLPEVGPGGATRWREVLITGDLTGIPLLKFALDTGARAAQRVAADPTLPAERTRHPERLDVLRYGAIALDRLRHLVTVADRPLELTAKEFQILEHFLLHPGEVVRRTTLLEKVWDMHFDPESNVVDVHVGNLRRKLTEAAGEPLLSTVRGVGFRLLAGRGEGNETV